MFALIVWLSLVAARSEIEALNAEGLQLFDRKQYEQGIAVFEKAYALQQLPGFLYNMALGKRLLGRCSESAELYRRYLAAEPKVPNRKKVEARLEEMERCAAGQRPKESVEPQPPPADEAPTALEPAPVPPPPPAVVAEPEKKSGPMKWLATGLTVVAGGTAAGLMLWAKSDFDRFTATCAPACIRADWQGGKTRELVGWVLVGTAAVALVAAVVLWIAGL